MVNIAKHRLSIDTFSNMFFCGTYSKMTILPESDPTTR